MKIHVENHKSDGLDFNLIDDSVYITKPNHWVEIVPLDEFIVAAKSLEQFRDEQRKTTEFKKRMRI